MKIVHVVGARPNFMKIAPVMRAFEAVGGVQQRLVHTGQHYDDALSQRFFDELDIPDPDVNLGVGSASHAVQTGRVMIELEPVLERFRPDCVFTVGDVNSTLAAALVAGKRGIPLAHVEAGLRSGDWTMPEEVNRVLTDRLSDALFTTEPSARANLLAEGLSAERIHFVGNVMIDTLERCLPLARERDVARRLGLDDGPFVLVTLHRPGNVDEPERLREILEALAAVRRAMDAPVVVPMHPRTAERVASYGLGERLRPLQVLEPLGYLEFLSLMDRATVVLTDSGGIQEETTVLGVPCVTLRPNTERPVTVQQGTNRLHDGPLSELAGVVSAAAENGRASRRPELWDGRAAERIARITVDGWGRGRGTDRGAADMAAASVS